MRGPDGRTSYEVLADSIAPLTGGISVLDIGCGNGYGYEAICARFPTASYTGVDLAPDEVTRAKKSYPGAVFSHARAQTLPFANSSFDAVISHLALMLMDDVNAVLAECRRVLKPGGTFAVVVDNMATMGGELLELHRVAVQFASGIFKNMPGLRMGNFASGAGRDAAWAFAVAGFDPDSFSASDYTVSADRTAEEIRKYVRGLYIIGSMPAAALDGLWSQLRLEFESLSGSGAVRVEIPLRLMRAAKPL
jgi:SAM-dependent methyltransferase